jgi:predicted ATPase/class 3 adenylate cyclase
MAAAPWMVSDELLVPFGLARDISDVAEQPTGTVTLLFTDIEGSTRLLERLGPERYRESLELHRRLLRDAFERHGGYEVDYEGDAFFVAFADAADAVAAAAECQEALENGEWPEETPIRVRMGIHTGEPLAAPPKYVGMDVHKAARIMAAAHGGQVLLSDVTRTVIHGRPLRDLGLHRFKDLAPPQRVWQLGNDAFPPIRSLFQAHLPVQPTALVGRDREVAHVTAEITGGSRLVTVTGTGGIGKTRVALQAAAELADEFRDGVWFVSLSSVRKPGAVESAIARALGFDGVLREELQSRQVLLVLDNFEHVVDAAELVDDVIRSCAGVTLLVTSRERLGLLAETEFSLPPLPVEDGTTLFVERARRLDPAIEVDRHVRAIVERLDGLPLAIELAAGQVKLLSVEQIRSRLATGVEVVVGGGRDLPERQRTLRKTIEWSYDLLSELERELFVRLSVFAGSFDLDAASEVADARLETLAALLDKSLLRRGDRDRLFMLTTLRAFAFERLHASSDYAQIGVRHADYVLSRIGFGRVLDSQRLDVIDSLRGDLFAAIDSMHESSDSEREAKLIGYPRQYWRVRGLIGEVERLIERAFEHQQLSPAARDWLLYQRAGCELARGDYLSMAESQAELLELRREAGDNSEILMAIGGLAAAYQLTGAKDLAAALYGEAIGLARAGWGDQTALPVQLLNHANPPHGGRRPRQRNGGGRGGERGLRVDRRAAGPRGCRGHPGIRRACRWKTRYSRRGVLCSRRLGVRR